MLQKHLFRYSRRLLGKFRPIRFSGSMVYLEQNFRASNFIYLEMDGFFMQKLSKTLIFSSPNSAKFLQNLPTVLPKLIFKCEMFQQFCLLKLSKGFFVVVDKGDYALCPNVMGFFAIIKTEIIS